VRLTYAQKLCCGTAQRASLTAACYKTDSFRKPLILLTIFLCPFSVHSSRSLDFQGLAALYAALSTKLSTENAASGQSV
jgi:hypothetical protein